jgi:hypothetical protein
MGTRTITAFLATANQDPKRGIRLEAEALQEIAEAVRSERIPMLVGHDRRRRLSARVLTADVREAPDGTQSVFIEFELPESEYQEYAEEIKGMSIAFVANQQTVNPESGLPPLNIFPDGSAYTVSEVRSGVQELVKHFTVTTGVYLQFAEVAPIVTVLEFAIQNLAGIPVGVFSAWLYDALKCWFSKPELDRSSVLRIRISGPAGVREMQLESQDEHVLERGLSLAETLMRDDSSDSPLFYDHESEKWVLAAER